MSYRECRQARLAREVYEYILENTESFETEDNIGADLAYLMGAILKNDRVVWPDLNAVMVTLNDAPKDHPVRAAFKYIHRCGE